jgi:hypothetical protein
VRDAVALASRIAAQVAGAAREQGASWKIIERSAGEIETRRGASRKRRRAPPSRPKTCARRSQRLVDPLGRYEERELISVG